MIKSVLSRAASLWSGLKLSNIKEWLKNSFHRNDSIAFVGRMRCVLVELNETGGIVITRSIDTHQNWPTLTLVFIHWITQNFDIISCVNILLLHYTINYWKLYRHWMCASCKLFSIYEYLYVSDSYRIRVIVNGKIKYLDILEIQVFSGLMSYSHIIFHVFDESNNVIYTNVLFLISC